MLRLLFGIFKILGGCMEGYEQQNIFHYQEYMFLLFDKILKHILTNWLSQSPP